MQQAGSFKMMSGTIPKIAPKKIQAHAPPHQAALKTAVTITPTNVESVKYGSNTPTGSNNNTPTSSNWDNNGNLNIIEPTGHVNQLSSASMQLNDVKYDDDDVPTMNNFAKSTPATQFYRGNSKNKHGIQRLRLEKEDSRTMSDPSYTFDNSAPSSPTTPEHDPEFMSMSLTSDDSKLGAPKGKGNKLQAKQVYDYMYTHDNMLIVYFVVYHD